MLILIMLGTAALLGVSLYLESKRKKHETDEEKIFSEIKISQMNTLLHNVEVYDGSPKGQKKIGGDKQ